MPTIEVEFGHYSQGEPFLRSDLRTAGHDCLGSLFSTLHRERSLRQLEDFLVEAGPWRHWEDSSIAESHGPSHVRIFGPFYDLEESVVLPRDMLHSIVSDWKSHLAGERAPRSVSYGW